MREKDKKKRRKECNPITLIRFSHRFAVNWKSSPWPSSPWPNRQHRHPNDILVRHVHAGFLLVRLCGTIHSSFRHRPSSDSIFCLAKPFLFPAILGLQRVCVGRPSPVGTLQRLYQTRIQSFSLNHRPHWRHFHRCHQRQRNLSRRSGLFHRTKQKTKLLTSFRLRCTPNEHSRLWNT